MPGGVMDLSERFFRHCADLVLQDRIPAAYTCIGYVWRHFVRHCFIHPATAPASPMADYYNGPTYTLLCPELLNPSRQQAWAHAIEDIASDLHRDTHNSICLQFNVGLQTVLRAIVANNTPLANRSETNQLTNDLFHLFQAPFMIPQIGAWLSSQLPAFFQRNGARKMYLPARDATILAKALIPIFKLVRLTPRATVRVNIVDRNSVPAGANSVSIIWHIFWHKNEVAG